MQTKPWKHVILSTIILLLLLCFLLPVFTAQPSRKMNYLTQEIILILPAFNKTDDIYSPGFGGSLAYENYALNRLWGENSIPGLVLGCELSALIYLPVVDSSPPLLNSALLLCGGYAGYRFSIPLTGRTEFNPALYAGGKYYFSIHPGSDPSFASNPLFCAGADLPFILDQFLILGPSLEYQLYYDGRNRPPGHTIQFSIGVGFLF